VTDPDPHTSRPPAGAASADLPPDEFAHIPSRTRPPVVALLAAALALFLAVRLRHDVAYALSSAQPIELGDARALAARPPSAVPINRLVRLHGQPERESAVVLDARGSWTFTQFFRMRGTSGRVFVRRVADPLPIAMAEHDIFEGRLVAFGNLSFAESISHHFATHVSATHFFAPATLAAALAAGAGPWQVSDRAGDQVTLAAGDRLAIDIARPGLYLIEVAREHASEVARIKTLLASDGGRIAEQSEAADRTLITAAIPEAARDRLLSAIGQQGRGVHFRAARETIEVPVSALQASAGGWQIAGAGGQRLVRFDDVIAVRTRATVQIPADALLLLEGEVPRDETKSLVFLAFLAGFAVVNLLGLRKAR
jgi:hypothetical protein